MKIHKDSHVDHELSMAVCRYLVERYKDRKVFFIEEVTLPEHLGTVPCGLYGPVMGDAPVGDDEVELVKRGERAWASRMVRRPRRQSRIVTVVAGPHEGEFILYTAYGGPQAPREPGDPSLSEAALVQSMTFWAEHALALGP